MADTFYVVLPSNTPGPTENTISNFSVRLPNTLDLSEGDWSVALSSIIYPVSYQADSQEEMSVGIVYARKAKKVIKFLPNVSFSSIEGMEKTINETIIGHEIQQPRTTREATAAEEPTEEPPTELSDKEQKLLTAARNEVQTRSFIASQELSNIIDEKITEVERNGAIAEDLKFGMEARVVINENFNKEEAADFIEKIERAQKDAVMIRNNAQRKRVNLSAHMTEYSQLLTDFDESYQEKNLPACRKLANQAKDIVKKMKEMSEWLEGEKKSLKLLVGFLTEIAAELTEMLKPMDVGMKNTIARIKEVIGKRLEKNLASLEIYFYFDHNYGRFFLYVHKPLEIKAVTLSPRLAYMLGFETDKLTQEIKHVRVRQAGGFAKFTPDIKAGVHQLYVYAPGIVESSFVGNLQVPLLRIVNVDKPPNSIAESIYSNLHFIKVIEKRISNIRIQIHDAFGEFIKFNWGTVIITLAFRRSLF